MSKEILIISSVCPSVGPAILSHEHFKMLRDNGFKVDLLCLKYDEKYPEVTGVLSRNRILAFFQRFYLLVRQFLITPRQKDGFCFFYRKEDFPEVPANWVLKKIDKKYDLIEILFWQGMLSYKTVQLIYKKVQCPIRFCCVDYSVMAGGCHFTGECTLYESGCGCCPGIFSSNKNDFTSYNVNFRKTVIDEIHPYVYVNNYMKSFFEKSFLFKDYDRLMLSSTTIDMNVFKPLNRDLIIKKIIDDSENYSFFMLIGSQHLDDERKGGEYLIKALDKFYELIGQEDSAKVLILMAGKNASEIGCRLRFKYKDFGYVNIEKLVELFNIADVFLSPSVNDAGPLMVNYSIACGTPVVAFEMGAALSSVKNQGTGYCAKLRDVDDFARGIYNIYRLSAIERQRMSDACLKYSDDNFSEKGYIKVIDKLFKEV